MPSGKGKMDMNSAQQKKRKILLEKNLIAKKEQVLFQFRP